MRLLVTGGAGFIGSNFVHRAIREPDVRELIVFDSLTYAGSTDNLSDVINDIDFIHGNILDSELLDRFVSKSDVVVHFAAESHNDNSLANPDLFYQTNLMGTLGLAKSCLKHDVYLHHISTDEVFGDLPLKSTDKFDLRSRYAPSSPYSASKAAADHLIRAWVRSFGLVATISNCSNNYGKRQNWEKLIPRTIALLAQGEKAQIYGDGQNVRDWISVEDHVEGVLQILRKGEPGQTYLLSAHDESTNLSIVSKIAFIMGKDLTDLEFIKDRPGHDLRYALDASETTQKLGWMPKSRIESSLESLVDWYTRRL